MTLAAAKEGEELSRVSALVETKSVGLTKLGKSYLRLSLKDESGSLKCVFWDYDPEKSQKIDEGSVYEFDIWVESYNGSPQGVIRSFWPSDRDPKSFAKKTSFDVEAMWRGLEEMVSSFEEPLTKFVTQEFLFQHAKVIEAFKEAPAARGVHNAWYGGLLEHVWSLCQIAVPVIGHYKRNYFKDLSRDKVLFGLLMHDAGKIVEYDYSTPAFKSSASGILANHIVMGPAWVYEIANRWPDRAKDPEGFKMERAHLMHILAAHHGKLEWGSPVKPATVEAVLVHHLDNLDSKMLHAHDFVFGKEGSIQGFSEKSYIEQTYFMMHK